MGFDTAVAGIATDMVTNAVGLLGDFAPVVGVVFGIAALGMMFAVVAKFIDRS